MLHYFANLFCFHRFVIRVPLFAILSLLGPLMSKTLADAACPEPYWSHAIPVWHGGPARGAWR